MFDELLTQGTLALQPRDRKQVTEFVEHNEFGLAFDELLAAIREESLEIDELDFSRIDRIGRTIGLDPSTWEDIGNDAGERGGQKANGADT
jgi:hypothetical protein